MKRYNQDFADMELSEDGEWIRYEDHCEAMKRIAAPSASAQQAEPVASNADIARWCWREFTRTYSGHNPTHDETREEFMRAIVKVLNEHRAAPAPSTSPASIAVTENMVSRFLGWRVPDDFSPDCGISFAPIRYKGEIFSWPIGTNLLSAVQARQMLEHVLAEPSASPEPVVLYGGGETPISFEDGAAPAALTDSYVQTVPDHCDRIVWRNAYYHLPLAASPASLTDKPVAYVGWGGEGQPKTLLLKADLPVGTSLYAKPVAQQAKADDEKIVCPECHGIGRVEVTHEPLRDGYTETIRECCDTCQGTGKIAAPAPASPAALTDEAAMRVALRIMANLEDRNGLLDGVDDDTKADIADEIAVTIRAASPEWLGLFEAA